MSTTEKHPAERLQRPDDARACESASDSGVLVLQGREVPLGGPRAMTVRRTLPHRERSFVGAWCFVDHYGPDDVSATGGMDVPPHPHTGLATVSWLFEGEVEHRDSGGVHAMVRPGEVNLMTAGGGICHCELSTPGTSVLHGAQLWFALPDSVRHSERSFQHHAAEAVQVAPGATCRVFIGSLAGQSSPVETPTPLLGAEVVLEPGARWEVPVDPAHEHGVLVDGPGELRFCGQMLSPADLGVVDAGREALTLEAGPGERVRLLLLGGEPFDEQIIMWWNFIGRTHEEIEQYRAEWNSHDDRFGAVEGYVGRTRDAGDEPVTWLPAPPLPQARLRTRGRRPA